MAIRCCRDCVAPKRYPGCHGTCPEHIREKAQHDAAREEAYRARSVECGLTSQRFQGVNRAEKRKRHHKGV